MLSSDLRDYSDAYIAFFFFLIKVKKYEKTEK